MFDYLVHLDSEQQAVATSDAKHLRVLAGAGTGKTTALSARVAHLVETGALPERILLLTFTRRAARQMVERTDALLARTASRSPAGSGRSASRLSGGTFHSAAHRVLRQHAAQLGLPDGFGVIDPSDAADVMDMVRTDVLATRTTGRRFPRKATLLDIYSRAVDREQPLSEVIPELAPWSIDCLDDIAAICRGYVTRKRSIGVLDFDDLLLHWRAALRQPALTSTLISAFDHVLVDEYQDVNALQVDLLKHLTSGGQSLTVVGDDAQAIYSFRSSTPRHILDFEGDFADAQTLPLATNYRSSGPILAVANAVAGQALEGFSTILRVSPARAHHTELPRIIKCADEDAQSDAVCERILELRENGLQLKEQAVLVRAAHHSDRLELELSRRAIPYVKYGGLRYLEAAHVKDLLAAYRLADNPRDELSWFRVLQLLDGVGPVIARRAVEQLAPSSSQDADIMMRWPLACHLLPSPVQRQADALAAALVRGPTETIAAQAERLRQAMTPLITGAYSNAAARLTDLDALVDAAGQVERLCDVAAEHSLEPPHSTGNLAGPPVVDEDWLVISTVHSAKGLEWDAVHVIHAADGNFPADMALGSADGLEEERRLFYVALTRPRKHLDVYVPLRYHHHRNARNDRHSWAQPSRFLSHHVSEQFQTVTYVRGDELPLHDLPSIDTTALVDSSLDGLWQ
ncbi:MAG: ATP-dependent helicase [Actinomycetes bacterium]